MLAGMEKSITEFGLQFNYQPEIECSDSLQKTNKYVLVGMGGSHLQADVIKKAVPTLDIVVWSDYGLPLLADIDERLIVFSSYSGNTEEVLDAYALAGEKKYHRAVLTAGGKLLECAKAENVAYVELPNTGIQPRNALGLTVRGLLALLSLGDELQKTDNLIMKFGDTSLRILGEKIASQAQGKIPVVYSSRRNETIAFNWKIKCNETGKIPAFYNVFPELNHNELAGMDVIEKTRVLSESLFVIFILDSTDDKRIAARMNATQALYDARGIKTVAVTINGDSEYEKIFTTLLIGDWFALSLAKIYGAEPEKVLIIEEFKKMIS
ncbi:MAG: SIS domain-containing protein [bacterium]|nr:SIS domain-containing protein [bacterium]